MAISNEINEYANNAARKLLLSLQCRLEMLSRQADDPQVIGTVLPEHVFQTDSHIHTNTDITYYSCSYCGAPISINQDDQCVCEYCGVVNHIGRRYIF